MHKFYRYKGSLTTPPCYESVIWIVFPDVIPISEKQVRIELVCSTISSVGNGKWTCMPDSNKIIWFLLRQFGLQYIYNLMSR